MLSNKAKLRAGSTVGGLIVEGSAPILLSENHKTTSKPAVWEQSTLIGRYEVLRYDGVSGLCEWKDFNLNSWLKRKQSGNRMVSFSSPWLSLKARLFLTKAWKLVNTTAQPRNNTFVKLFFNRMFLLAIRWRQVNTVLEASELTLTLSHYLVLELGHIYPFILNLAKWMRPKCKTESLFKG